MGYVAKAVAGIALGVSLFFVAPTRAGEPVPRVPDPATRALHAAAHQPWTTADRQAAQADDPLIAKVVDWLQLQRRGAQAPFSRIADFIDGNPAWPRLTTLRRNAEAVVKPTEDAAAVSDWFERYPPLTGDGALAHLDALARLGALAENRSLIAHYWRELDFAPAAEKEFRRRYRNELSRDDNLVRLDRLIWDQKYWPARRMLSRVGETQAALGFARLALMRRQPGVDAAIARVPENLQQAPALQYERLRWRRRQGMDLAAREILFTAPAVVPRSERWATERHILARRALDDGHYTEAYRLVAAHGVNGGVSFAEAEFLAGWIMLTLLDEPDAAYLHFKQLFDGVQYPISRARGAFWAGRAAAAAGDAARARRWWEVAAEHPTTFYGQQAIAALGRRMPSISFAVPQASARFDDYRKRELAEVAELLQRHGARDLVKPFLRHLTEISADTDERLIVARLAHEIGHPAEAVRSAKRVAQIDNVVAALGYPAWPADIAADNPARDKQPLVLSVILQESAFEPHAVSRAGARGLMQLIPATAKRLARSSKQPYSRQRLLDDDDYNVRLGSSYLRDLLERFDGVPALALAAYNAGPHRVERWLKQIGDPRTDELEMIDWIESIPFGETRNYVQRVLEAMPIYQQLLDQEERFAAVGYGTPTAGLDLSR